jgi:NSS family neurotransmitter:Na+ symporter
MLEAAAEAPGERERWPGRFSFVMAAIGSAVGLGNVWRFPYVAYANGGGAFFIPYFVALLTAGIPLLILEFAVGQMMQGSAPRSMKRLNRNFEWVGWFALLVGGVIAVYYAVVMAYAWDYLWYSLSSAPQWSAGGAGTEGAFFEQEFLGFSTAPGERWGLRLPIVIGLALTWIAVFLIIFRGVRRIGKIVLVTVPVPWIIILVLAIRGLTLDGASAGIEYYLKPDWDKLTEPSTWLAAYGQIFFSLTIGFGVMIAYASYRPRHSDVTNNAFITSFANCLTSFFAGFAVFSVLGFLAFKNGVPVGSVVGKSFGLAFVTYPAAITKMGDLGSIWPPLIGILFFVALLTLGIDSLFSLVEAVGAGFKDSFPGVNRTWLTAAMCAGAFCLGLLFCTRSGLAWLDVIDNWANNYGLAIVGLLQCLLIGYFFSTHRVREFADDVSEIKLGGWWELCIKVITPVVLVYLIGRQLMQEFAAPAGAGYPGFMRWAALGLFLALFAGAFAITRKWSYLALAGIALVAGLATYGIVRPASVEVAAESAALRGGEAREVGFHVDVSGAEAPYAVLWDFGDGTESKELNPTHTYRQAGTYAASVQVSGRDGRGKTAAGSVEVNALPLSITKAGIARRRTVRDAGDPLAYGFEAEAAYGREPYVFEWSFGDGAKAEGKKGEHDYARPGAYQATLTVKDASGQKAERRIAVEVLPFAVELEADPRGGECPALVDFGAKVYGTDEEELPAEGFAFHWDFGDGASSTGAGKTSHRYDWRPGPPAGEAGQAAKGRTLTASVTVRRAAGGVAVERTEIHLRPPEEHAPWRAALVSAVGATLLLGGLALSLGVALRRRQQA